MSENIFLRLIEGLYPPMDSSERLLNLPRHRQPAMLIVIIVAFWISQQIGSTLFEVYTAFHNNVQKYAITELRHKGL